MVDILRNICATFGRKMGVATTRAPNGLGLPNPTKKLAHWVEPFGPTTILKSFFRNFQECIPL